MHVKAAPTKIFPLKGLLEAVTRAADGEKKRRRRGERRMKGKEKVRRGGERQREREGEKKGSGGVGGEGRRVNSVKWR